MKKIMKVSTFLLMATVSKIWLTTICDFNMTVTTSWKSSFRRHSIITPSPWFVQENNNFSLSYHFTLWLSYLQRFFFILRSYRFDNLWFGQILKTQYFDWAWPTMSTSSGTFPFYQGDPCLVPRTVRSTWLEELMNGLPKANKCTKN